MSAQQHTPGPWQVVASIPQEGFECLWIKAQPSPMARGFTREIAVVPGPQSAEAAANASLIAAAPEMLEALKLVERDRLNCNGRVLELHAPIIRAAIAKAEGR